MLKSMITISKITILQPQADVRFDSIGFLGACTLRWRCDQLWVKRVVSDCTTALSPTLPALQSRDWLIACLKQSSAKLVVLDSNLHVEVISSWADVCTEAGKPVFIRGRSERERSNKDNPLLVRTLCDRLIAVLSLLMLSPLMLVLSLLLFTETKGSTFQREWRVSERGKLFRALQFRTQPRILLNQRWFSPIGQWLFRTGLYRLPQLFNVLTGDMRLLRRYSCKLANLEEHDLVTCYQQGRIQLVP